MKRSVKILSGCLCGLWLTVGGLRAINDTANPYRAITDRNVFSLLPPDPPKPVEPPAPPANIKLTGITTIFGNKRALLMVQDTAPGGKEQSYMMSEGQREGDVEILEINEREGAVKLKNAGTEAMLTFDKDGLKPPAGPPVAGTVPGASPGMPGGPAVVPGTAPGGLRQIPSRQLRGQENVPQAGAGYGVPSKQVINPSQNFSGQSVSGQGFPQGNFQQTGSHHAGSQNDPGGRPLSIEEQVALQALQNEANRNNPAYPQIALPDF